MMNKFFILLFSLSFFSYVSKAQDMYKVKADKLNVRASKDPGSKKIGAIMQNDSVAVIDSADVKYFKIKIAAGEGYVSKEYLQRISSPAKQLQTAAPVIEQKVTDNSTLIFHILVVVIMIALLFFIFKFVPNKILMVFFVMLVLASGYFFYIGFIAKKTIAGKYISADDAQYQSFDFKSKDSVVIKDSYLDSLTTAHYTIEGDVIKFKQQENTFMLMIRDNNTLVGEGFTKGIFKKN